MLSTVFQVNLSPFWRTNSNGVRRGGGQLSYQGSITNASANENAKMLSSFILRFHVFKVGVDL